MMRLDLLGPGMAPGEGAGEGRFQRALLAHPPLAPVVANSAVASRRTLVTAAPWSSSRASTRTLVLG